MAEKKTVLEKDISAGAGKNEKNQNAEKKGGGEKKEGSEKTEGTARAEGDEKTKGIAGIERVAGTRQTENKFTKEQLLGSKRFRERRDIVDALLTEGEQYTIKVVEQKIENYMKGRVK